MRKTKVWYKKNLTVQLTQISLCNASVLYRCTGSRGTILQFQKKVIKSLIFAEHELEASTSTSSTSRIVPGQHFPAEIPVTRKTKKPPKRCCFVVKYCFEIYHTSLDFNFFFRYSLLHILPITNIFFSDPSKFSLYP